ncbi:MAG: S-methyl-5-thioribose-1-phosphate isomerase [Spirochaetota bacterium]|jgi:methylthioribose-1-phosphate isomerase|nr:S-methyl-5-thioribose-1-phosphate isomerase [Spirochaetota bacterium]NLK13779.1 S-methyl-5-thioribose-1-phosphate isomerase [Spirochaetales bacterium]
MIHLPFLLTEDGVCRLQEECLFILDRRRYPFERVEVPCRSAEEVATAFKEMVTQGGGPLEAALKTMIMEARNHERLSLFEQIQHLRRVARLLSDARPTNTTMARALDEVIAEVEKRNDESPSKVVEETVRMILDRFAGIYHQIGKLGSTLINDGDRILTTCFAEHTFLLSLLYAKQAGKHVRVLVSETRPYLQGSRLAAPSLEEAGIPLKIITDGMGPTMIAAGEVQVYMTAADLVCRDGTVVNKIGTLANALACSRYGIPYYALAISPDPNKKTRADVTIEMRDPKEVTQCMGMRTTFDTIEGVYPAFDIVDPELVTRIITQKGILKPSEVEEHGR